MGESTRKSSLSHRGGLAQAPIHRGPIHVAAKAWMSWALPEPKTTEVDGLGVDAILA
jgi:hypothetical protein